MTENSQITIYQTADGSNQIEVRLEQGTLWLNLLQLAELFGRGKSVISRHLKNIFDTGELAQQATVAKNATVKTEAAGKSRVRSSTSIWMPSSRWGIE